MFKVQKIGIVNLVSAETDLLQVRLKRVGLELRQKVTNYYSTPRPPFSHFIHFTHFFPIFMLSAVASTHMHGTSPSLLSSSPSISRSLNRRTFLTFLSNLILPTTVSVSDLFLHLAAFVILLLGFCSWIVCLAASLASAIFILPSDVEN